MEGTTIGWNEHDGDRYGMVTALDDGTLHFWLRNGCSGRMQSAMVVCREPDGLATNEIAMT